MFNATETRTMKRSAIRFQSAFFRKDYHLSAVVLLFAIATTFGKHPRASFCPVRAKRRGLSQDTQLI